MNEFLGDLTVVLNIIVLFLIIFSSVKYVRDKKLDLQFLILMGSILLLQPVIIFENVLYLEIVHHLFDLNYSTVFMRFLFTLGTLSYFVYNLHLMTIADIPSFPVAITALITGLGIGSMIFTASVDDTLTSPIYYEPITGGIVFITSLMAFNIVGAIGFFTALITNKRQSIAGSVSTLDMFGIFFFFVSPMVIYLARIIGIASLPVNAIFLVTLLGFGIHLSNYLLNNERFGYPLHADMVSLSIIDIEKSVVVAGISTETNDNFNKLQGMTIMAVDSVIKDVFEIEKQDKDRYSMQYGDTILLRYKQFLLVSLFFGKGKKIGKAMLNHFLTSFVNDYGKCNQADFKELVSNKLYTFFKKKHEITDDHIFLSRVELKKI